MHSWPLFTSCGGQHFTVLQVYITRNKKKYVQAFKKKKIEKKKTHTFLPLIVITFPSMLAKE